MKQTLKLQLIAFFLFLSSSSFQTEIYAANDSSAESSLEAQRAEITEFARDAVVNSFNFLQKIENKLTEIALLVKKGLFNKYTAPSKIIEVLTENKMMLNSLLQGQASIISIEDPKELLNLAFILSELSNAFIPYLVKQIATNFKNAKPFDLNRFLMKLNQTKTRSDLSHLEPFVISKRLLSSERKVAVLDLTVQNIGLTWYNKAARALDGYVVTPANRWHVPTIAAYGAMAGTLSVYLLWHFGNYFQDNEDLPEFVTDFVKNTLLANKRGPLGKDRMGMPYIVGAENDGGGRYNNSDSFYANIPKDASILAVLDWAVTDLLLNQHPLAAMGAGYAASSLLKTWKDAMYPTIQKKAENWWNLLRGGEYLNTYRPGITQMKPTVTFDDMVGLDEVKKAFYAILQYIDNPEQLMRIEATPEKGWLLTGPTRTGKSFSVECLCGEIERIMAKRGMANTMKFFNINATLVNQFGIKDILHEVYENAPAVIFLDEIDLLGLQRVGNNQMLSEFLTAMQSSMNADPSKIVIIIAATNNPENLDKALRQNGRFGKEIRFEYPSKKYRIKFLIRELTNMALNIKEFDIETLANKTNNRSFEDLKRVIRNAMTRSWLHGVSLTQELLEESIDTELHNIRISNDKDLPENELRMIASHFAGAAIAAMHLETHEQLDKITIHSRMIEIEEESALANALQLKQNTPKQSEQKKIEYGALLKKKDSDTINVKNAQTIINEVMVLIAGFAAEELLLGRCGFTCHEKDRDKARQMLEDLIFGGLDPEKLPKSVREELKTKAYNQLAEYHLKTMELLKEHQDALIAVTEELIKKQILNDKEIQKIIDKAEGRVTPDTDDNDDSDDDIFAISDDADEDDDKAEYKDQADSIEIKEMDAYDLGSIDKTNDTSESTTGLDLATETSNDLPTTALINEEITTDRSDTDVSNQFLDNATSLNTNVPIKTYIAALTTEISDQLKTATKKCKEFAADQQKSFAELIKAGYAKVVTYLPSSTPITLEEEDSDADDDEYIVIAQEETPEAIEIEEKETAFNDDIETQVE